MDSHEDELAQSQGSTKLPFSTAQPDCLLAVGSQRFAAILTDECETGMHVQIQGSPLFWVEDSGVLQTPDSEISVRVANIVRIESIEDQFVSSIPAFRIGLTCLGQAEEKPAPTTTMGTRRPPAFPLGSADSIPLSDRPPGRIRAAAGGLIALVMIATPLALVAAAWRHHVQQAGTNDAQQAVMPPSTAPEVPQPAKPAILEPTPETLKLPGIEPFLRPEVIAKLELTPTQTDAIGRLDKTTREALQDLEKYWESVGRLELARRRDVVLEAAREEALQLLTDQQRRQWEAMTR